MEVYVILQTTSYSDYEFCGVFATKEKAQARLDEIVKEIPRLVDNMYIEKYEIE